MRLSPGHRNLGVRALVSAIALLISIGAPGALGHLGHQTGQPVAGIKPVEVPSAPLRMAPEPPLTPTPRAKCGPGSRPETGIQGRVSAADHESGRAAKGYTCNTRLIGSFAKPNPVGSIAGFKVERYVDEAGHECAYYDTTGLYPTNLFDGDAGVNVLDMSDPSKPVFTKRLISPAMLSPHESLQVSKRAGLLLAVMGNPLFNLGIVDIYDVSIDCRYPQLRSSSPVGFLGHESGISPDGRTFYSASPGTSLAAVDISNPSDPRTLWLGAYNSHGLTISGNGNRAYVADIGNVLTDEGSGLTILDISEIEARVRNPEVREVSRLTWTGISIPQNAIPIKIKRHPYVLEIDEYGALSQVGAGRIIDIGNERRPRVISNLRLQVHQQKNFSLISGDPGAGNYIGGYSGHYCNVPRPVDPKIVACSMNLSGLRIFDIRDPYHPKEIAYFNAPVTHRDIVVYEAQNWAMARPTFVPKRHEVWYTDTFQGFYAVKLTNGVWPTKH